MNEGRPAHHLPHGGFRNPWPDGQAERGFRDVWRWARERRSKPVPRYPDGQTPVPARPQVARPAADPRELRLTWVGHATFLIQIGGFNILTDPVWSDRVSPVPWAGPRRLVPPGLPFDELPEVHVVLISHDHYDHLDAPTVRRLAARWPDLIWLAPLGHAAWLRARGARHIHECDWWDVVEIRRQGSALATVPAGRARPAGASASAGALAPGAAGTEAAGEVPAGGLRIIACPAQHWTRRRPLVVSRRLWAGWVVASSARRVYFAGDSGYAPVFREIGARTGGGFDAVILPIGAYEPRWFMRGAHMDPAEAVAAYGDLGGRGRMVPMHWGTFVLTDEPVLEPPALLREAWARAEWPADDLSILGHGETLILSDGP